MNQKTKVFIKTTGCFLCSCIGPNGLSKSQPASISALSHWSSILPAPSHSSSSLININWLSSGQKYLCFSPYILFVVAKISSQSLGPKPHTGYRNGRYHHWVGHHFISESAVLGEDTTVTPPAHKTTKSSWAPHLFAHLWPSSAKRPCRITMVFICCRVHLFPSWGGKCLPGITLGLTYEILDGLLACYMGKKACTEALGALQTKTIKAGWIPEMLSSVFLCIPGKRNINNFSVTWEGAKHSKTSEYCQLSLHFFPSEN